MRVSKLTLQSLRRDGTLTQSFPTPHRLLSCELRAFLKEEDAYTAAYWAKLGVEVEGEALEMLLVLKDPPRFIQCENG